MTGGLYTKISNDKNLAATNTAEFYKYNGISSHSEIGLTLAQTLPSLFMLTLSKVGNLSDSEKASESDAVGADKAEQAQREELQRQLKSALREIGAEDENGINEAVHIQQTERDEKVEAAQTEVDSYRLGTDKYSAEIKELQGQIATGEELTPEQQANNEKIQNKIEKLEAKKEDALQKAQANLEKTIQTEDAKVNQVYTKAQEAINILEELTKLNNEGINEDVKVEERTEALADFTKYRLIMTSQDTTPEERYEAANKLEEIASNNSENKTISDAYKALEAKIGAAKHSYRDSVNDNNPLNSMFKKTEVTNNDYGLLYNDMHDNNVVNNMLKIKKPALGI